MTNVIRWKDENSLRDFVESNGWVVGLSIDTNTLEDIAKSILIDKLKEKAKKVYPKSLKDMKSNKYSFSGKNGYYFLDDGIVTDANNDLCIYKIFWVWDRGKRHLERTTVFASAIIKRELKIIIDED